MKKNLPDEVQKALHDLGMDTVDWQRRISASDVVYLLDQCPFLQIMNTGFTTEELPPLQLVTAKSGWKIHNYGNAISSSPGLWLFGNPKTSPTVIDGREGSGSSGTGTGTLVNQAVTTAMEMVRIAIEQGWEGIQLVDGHPLMAWAAWMQSLDAGLDLEGYAPTAKDMAKRRRIKGPAAGQITVPKPR